MRLGQRTRLVGRPGSDLAVPRASGEIGVGLGVGHRRHRPADAHLAAQGLPVKQQRRLGVGRQFASLGAPEVGVEDEPCLVETLEQHGARVGQAVGVDGRQGHGVGVGRLAPGGGGQPFGEQREGVGVAGGDVLVAGVGLVVGLGRGRRDQVRTVGLSAHDRSL